MINKGDSSLFPVSRGEDRGRVAGCPLANYLTNLEDWDSSDA